MVLVGPTGAVFVKTLEYFREQGGFKDEWGQSWFPVVASSLYDARLKGAQSRGIRLSTIHRGEGEES